MILFACNQEVKDELHQRTSQDTKIRPVTTLPPCSYLEVESSHGDRDDMTNTHPIWGYYARLVR